MDRGETLALVGESGSGKSVTSLAVNGLLPKGTKVGGEARFSGQDVLAATERDRERLRGRHIAMIFQDPQSSLNPVSGSTSRSARRSAPTSRSRRTRSGSGRSRS